MQSHLQNPIRPSSCPATPAPHALRAFRALTLSRSRGIRHVAAEVNGYVDAVAREREKERERLRRERERDGGHRASGGPTRPALSARRPLRRRSLPRRDSAVRVCSCSPPPLPQPVVGPIQQPQAQAPSTFYPSPPQADPPFAVPLTESRTSPVVPDPPPIPVNPTPIALPPAIVPTEMQTQPQLPPPTSFDPFDSQYMDIDMAMNDFGNMSGMGG
ncbi:hypothetical protein B0H13DRAFT_2305044 [Mycena leptocephala]|nr:hypothetical protein B0H13DRAFT_2305044 [Mycena leptocephala]